MAELVRVELRETGRGTATDATPKAGRSGPTIASSSASE